jgi:hypothetical protein
MEVNQQTNLQTQQPQMGSDLSLVHGVELLLGLAFDNHLARDDQVCSKTAFDLTSS